jgi:hypothetical protein
MRVVRRTDVPLPIRQLEGSGGDGRDDVIVDEAELSLVATSGGLPDVEPDFDVERLLGAFVVDPSDEAVGLGPRARAGIAPCLPECTATRQDGSPNRFPASRPRGPAFATAGWRR